jgi:hypothetical protein
VSVFPSRNIRFKESLFFFGSFLPVVENIPDIHLTDDSTGSTYIVFGSGRKERNQPRQVIIGSWYSHGQYSPLTVEAGLRQDHTMSRTALPIDDFDGDTFEDLLICDPINSICFLYFGHVNGLQNLQVSFAIKSANNDLFGWSIAKLNDLNGDNHGDIAISALSSNRICIIFTSNSDHTDINIDQLDPSVGIKIIGSESDLNAGLDISSAGDFNSDGYSDILFSAIQITPYQNVIYVLFLRAHLVQHDIFLDHLRPKEDYFKITAPLFYFAGFSVSNLGDINQDEFDDIIIGSIPYSGRYLTQKSYVIYGRNSSNTLSLNEITEEDGFVITGGGFMVAGPGDVNGDGIPDIMISNYQQWQGKGNSYTFVYPRNVTSPPTLNPSSQPTSIPSYAPSALPSINSQFPTSVPTFEDTTNQPSHYGTFPPHLQRTDAPTVAPRTSHIPSVKPSTRTPTIRTNPPTLIPSRLPTENPTKPPTKSPTTKVPSRSPIGRRVKTSFPSLASTESLSTAFQDVIIDRAGVYNEFSGKLNFIISGEGNFEIMNNGGGNKIYTILPSKNTITITNFNKRYDQISLIHFPCLYSINDLVYRTNPLQILLSNAQKLVVFSLNAVEVTEDNFIFQNDSENTTKNTVGLSFGSVISLGILISCVGLTVFLVKVNSRNDDDERDTLKNTIQDTNTAMVKNDSTSFLLSSSDSEGEEADSSESEEETILALSENDWNMFSSLQSFFSFDDEEEEEQSFAFTESDYQQVTGDGSGIDIEGNYDENDEDDIEKAVSFIQHLFNNSY